MLDRKLAALIKQSPVLFAVSVAFAFTGGLATILQAWLLSSAIDGAFLRGQAVNSIVPILFLLALAAVVRFGSVMTGEIAASEVALRIKSDLRQRVIRHLLDLGPAFASGERTGELNAATVEGIESLDAYFSQYLPQLVISALIPLGIFLVVLPIDVISALVLLVTAPLIPLFIILIGNVSEGLTRQQFNLLSSLSAHFLDTLQGLATLKLLNRSGAQAAAVRDASERYAAATLGVLRVAFLSALVLEIVATISTAIIAVEIGLRVLYGRMGFQPALFILILAPEFYQPLRTLGQRFHAATSGVSAMKRIAEILAVEPQNFEDRRRPASGINAVLESTSGPITFQDVHYAYANRPALRGVTFEIRRGETLALFGPTGSGKSTIFALLLGFMAPTAGSITVDGTPLADLDLDDWRKRIAWVPQFPHLMHESIFRNISIARPDASVQEVERAAENAGLGDWIRSLPSGYDTVVGEHGARVSGGQAQRMAIARAFLRDAPILLLDEPTSNADPETEAVLQDSTERIMAGRTVVVIAHRLATVYRADRIMVLDGGRVVQAGKHAELLAGDGIYRKLVFSTGAIDASRSHLADSFA